MQAQLSPLDALQPFMKLTQANMELLTRYAFSPEVTTETLRSLQAVFEQGPAGFARLGTPQALAALVQGLMQNYSQFLADVSQTGYGALFQAPLAFMQQVQGATGNFVDLATRGGGRAR